MCRKAIAPASLPLVKLHFQEYQARNAAVPRVSKAMLWAKTLALPFTVQQLWLDKAHHAIASL